MTFLLFLLHTIYIFKSFFVVFYDCEILLVPGAFLGRWFSKNIAYLFEYEQGFNQQEVLIPLIIFKTAR